MPRVVVIGSANVDYVVAVDRLPAPGETVTDGTLLVNHGGKGANQAVAARRLGAEVRFLGCVGDDASGAAIRAALGAEGIGVEGLATAADAATGTALIAVDARGRNQIAVAPGANRRLTREDVARRADDLAWADVVLCQLEIPIATVLEALGLARERGKTTVLNPAPARDLDASVWPLVDYLTPNEGEAARLSGRPDLDPAAAGRLLLGRGVRHVIVTLGEQGVVVCDGTGDRRTAAFPVTAVDTTAAGDAFNGAFASALASGAPLGEATRFGMAAAALACTRRGAQTSLPWRREVEEMLRGMSAGDHGVGRQGSPPGQTD
ncbi:MAG TPA: ribokinase [Solirubrobacteraceae bacterium]